MKQILIAGALAILLIPHAAHAQQPQAIPDAPKPQSLPPVTPGIGSTGASTSAPASDGEQAPGTALPASPSSDSIDRDPVPDLPEVGHGASSIYKLNLVSNFVDVPFTVKDSKGNLVPGIDWREVRIYENNVRQHPAVFTVDPFPLSVALVIDQSLPTDTMTRVNNALGALPAAFSKYDEVAVFTYNNGPKMQTDFTSGESARLSAIIERSKSTGRDAIWYSSGPMSRTTSLNGGAQDNINPLVSGGPGSPQGLSGVQVPREVHTLNDAILMAAISLSKAAPDRLRVIYVISDGKEFGSTAKQKDVIHYLQENKIAVYATLTGDSSIYGLGFLERRHIPLMMRDNILPAYTGATGGALFAEYRTPEIERSFSKITDQVRSQYTIGYYSREPFVDGKYRKLEVKILRPNMQVIAKDGYYPTAQAIRPMTATPLTPPAPQ